MRRLTTIPGVGAIIAASIKALVPDPAGFRSGRHLAACWADAEIPFERRQRAEAKSAQDGLVLTEAQVVALEKAKTETETHGEFESEHPGYCGAQDTFHVGNMKGVGRIYQQTFIDIYSKMVRAKLYDRRTPISSMTARSRCSRAMT